MTKQTISNSNPEIKPLKIIHVLGWGLDSSQEQELWPRYPVLVALLECSAL
jgi:hypothetical protein